MGDYIIDGAILTDIADAIRSKTSDTQTIIPEDMAGAVDALVVPSTYETWTITYVDGTVEEKEVALL